jgi:hypothetical protein
VPAVHSRDLVSSRDERARGAPFLRGTAGAIRGVGIAAVLACGAAPSVARADDAAGADVLFSQAKLLMEQDRPTEACPKFEASYGLDKRIGTLLNWADCLEKVDHLVDAEGHFRDARDLALRVGDPRSDYAEKRRAALPPRFAKLRLDVKVGAEKLEVFVDGTRVDESGFGIFQPADPRSIEIVVKRGEDTLDARKVALVEGAEQSVAVDLIAISKAHPKKSNVTVRAPQGQRIAGFVVGGVGLLGLIGFGVLEGVAYTRRSDSLDPGNCIFDAQADAFVCTPEGYALHQEAGDLAEAGQWTGIASAVVLGVGVTLLASAPRGAIVEEKGKPIAAVGPNGFFFGWRQAIE